MHSGLQQQAIAAHSNILPIHWPSKTSINCSKLADEQAQSVTRQLGAEFDKPVSVVLLPRVLGHGGFADEAITISYLDRNYAGSSPEIVLHHELVHKLDSQLGGDLRPSFFVEGLAVYLSGGHFKPEPLTPRAAALLHQGLYLPLTALVERFYISQHEIGYLEAGALVEYMIESLGQRIFLQLLQGYTLFRREQKPGGCD